MKEVANRVLIEEPRGFVYFVQMDRIGPIKIGFTKTIQKRMFQLQVSSPYPLKLIYHYPGDEDTEKEWHVAYADMRLEGEWFLPHPRLLKNIDGHRNMEVLFAEYDRIWKSFQSVWEKLEIERYWKDCPLLSDIFHKQKQQAKSNLRSDQRR